MKRKVIVDRERLSSEQINAKMNFESALTKVTPVPFYKTGWFITTLASVAVILTVTLLSFESPSSEEQAKKPEEQKLLASSPPSENLNFEYEEDTKCFNPPSKELDIPFESYSINNSKENIITTANSTEIIIPKEAILDNNGNPVSGNIEIKFREFHNPIEIYQSGIPMQYDSAGKEYTFESGGMIEMYGFKNGHPVTINPQKPIEIKFKNKDKNTALNLYDYDTVSNKWNYVGKPNFTQQSQEAENKNTEDNNTHSTQIVEIEDDENPTTTKEEVAEAKTTYETIKTDNKSFKKEAPKQPKTIKNPNNVFVLNIDPNDFPEFENYTQTKFEIDDANEWVNPAVFSTDWDNAVLSQHQSKGNYLLTLTTKSDEEKIIVHPVLEGADLEKAKQNFENDFKSYQTKLDKRLEAETEAKAYYEKKKKLYEEQLKLQKQRELIIAEQQKIAEQRAQLYIKSNTVKNDFTTSFQVKYFGTWNCDSPVNPPSGYALKDNFIDKNGNEVNLISVNLIEIGRNAIFDFTGRKIKINPEADNILFGMTLDNKIAVVSPSGLKKQIDDKDKAITFKVYDNAKMAIDELKALVLG